MVGNIFGDVAVLLVKPTMGYTLEDFVAFEKKKPITDKDVRMLVTRPIKIRNYDGLSKEDSLHSLLPRPGDGCVLFWKNRDNKAMGHFNLLLRYPSAKHGPEFEWFDSYGFSPQQVAARTTHDGAVKLTRLLKKHKVYYGRHAFQRGDDVNTCGRYCAFRYNCHQFKYDDFRQLMQYRGVAPDDLVTLLTISVDFSHINGRHRG